MKQTETALPLDYMASQPIQVGTLLTEDSTGSLLLSAALTSTAAAITISENRVYLITATSDFHINVRQDGTAATAATTSDFKIASGQILPFVFSEDTRISVIKASGELDGTLYIAKQ